MPWNQEKPLYDVVWVKKLGSEPKQALGELIRREIRDRQGPVLV